MVVVYGLPYTCFFKQTLIRDYSLIDTKQIKNENQTEYVTIKIKVVIRDKNFSIRDFVENNYVDNLTNFNYADIESRIFIICESELTRNQLNSAIEKVKNLNFKNDFILIPDNSDNDEPYFKNTESIKYIYSSKLQKIKPKKVYKDLLSAIFDYNSLIVFFGSYYSDNYNYINLNSKDNYLESNEDYIEYINFQNRFLTDKIEKAKRNNNGDIIIFESFFIKEVLQKVFVLNEKWLVLSKFNNKVAIIKEDNFIFWLLTYKYNFASITNEYSNDVPEDSATVINMNSLNKNEINYLTALFNKHHFYNLIYSEYGVHSIDKKNKLLLFTGIIKETKLGPFANVFII